MSDPNATPPYEPPAYQPPTGSAPAAGAPLSAADDKLWASLAHFGNIILLIPALIIYLVFKDRGPLVNHESKEALNWTINVTGAIVVINIVSTILGFIPFIGGILALLLSLVWIAILIVNLVFAIIGGVRVNGGGTYRYPFNYRWIK
ncbi:DUF4870 domain-containing protein [Subtercola endophyticus]|uniref:DUF4870 domain-containing protein n=1 Tax=Subtercola endophyticus TaxID=2895559 RepID=UPI001E462F1F|nr:DUF4870 domain-containing protein [Subtercola endophyticus]UFS60748.1 DUF4870 domain-containing protein [Subtercola endophyticus]